MIRRLGEGGGSQRRTFKTWRCCHTRCEMTRRLGEWGEGRRGGLSRPGDVAIQGVR